MKTLSTDHAGGDHAAAALLDPAAAPALPVVLNESESAELAAHETTIRAGLQTYVEVGLALAAIRDQRLYRAEFATFEDYCQEKWGVTARRARQLWAAAEVVRALGDHDGRSDFLLPATESQARALTWLQPQDRQPVWEEAVRTAPAGRVTAKHVEKIVRSRLGTAAPASAPIAGETTEPKRASRHEEKIHAAANAIAAARELEMKLGTADSAVTAQVKSAVEAFEQVVAHLKRVEQLHAARS